MATIWNDISLVRHFVENIYNVVAAMGFQVGDVTKYLSVTMETLRFLMNHQEHYKEKFIHFPVFDLLE